MRKLPKFLKILKIIQFYSILFNRVLSPAAQTRGGGHADALLEPSARIPAALQTALRLAVLFRRPGGTP